MTATQLMRATTEENGSAIGSVEVIELVAGLSARELDARLRIADRRTDVGHRELAFYLADMEDRGVHQLLGYSGAVAYATARLEMKRRTAQELIAVGRALRELVKIDAAFRDARLRWGRVRLLARVARPPVEDVWLETALKLPWLEFERAVAQAEPGRPPRDDRLGLPVVELTVRAQVGAATYEKLDLARRRLEAERGDAVTDGDLLDLAADLVLGSRAVDDAPGRVAVDESLYRVVIERCLGCRQAAVLTAEGPAGIEPLAAELIACDAHAEHVDEDVALSEATAESTEPAPVTPAWMRRRVMARDGNRCRACGARHQLHAHHVHWRSAGGPTRLSNMVVLCARCHALVHERLLIIEGTAPRDLKFLDRDRRPLGPADTALGPKIAALRADERKRGEVVATVPVDVAAAATAATAATAAATAAAAAANDTPYSARVTFSSVPRVVDSEWIARHAHLLRWDSRRGELRFSPGEPVEVESAERPSAAAAPKASGASGASNTAASAALSVSRQWTQSPRPARLAELVGQQGVVETLKVAIDAALRRGAALDHALFLGPPGLGKTTTARVLGAELGVDVQVLGGPTVDDAGVLFRWILGLKARSILFIDEIHALPRRIVESLYEAMEDHRISLSVGDGTQSKPLVIELPPFTLIGATTEAGRLPVPFEARFGLLAHFDPYPVEELSRLVMRAAARDGVEIGSDAADKLASFARGTPRVALTLLRRASDAALVRGAAGPVEEAPKIDGRSVDSALKCAGIDDVGLRKIERRALEALRRVGRGRPLGLARWGAAAGLSTEALRTVVELPLVELGLVEVTPHGRVATG